MKIKNILWILFIAIAVVVTGFNIYKIWNINNDNNYSHNEHEYNFESTIVDFQGIAYDTQKDDICSTFYAANNLDTVYSNNLICQNSDNCDIYWYSHIDSCVYKFSNGQNECIINKTTTCLIYYDNAIYFISPDEELNTNISSSVGYVWKYDLFTKEITRFFDMPVSSLCVIDNQFYCMMLNEENLAFCKISSDGTYENLNLMYCGVYKNYLLTYRYDVEGYPLLGLTNSETNEYIPLISNDKYISEQCIYKDTLYYRYFEIVDDVIYRNGNICCLNLLTAESKVYEIESLVGHSHELSYNFASDKLYLLSESKISCIDLLTDEVVKKEIPSHEHDDDDHNHNHSSYNRLFSDGENIYIIIEDENGINQLGSFNDFECFYDVVTK